MNEVNISIIDKDNKKGKDDPLLKAIFWLILP